MVGEVLVQREDLTTRTALSKSVLASFDMCPTKTWFGIHDPRPFVTNEKVEFGSALDAAVEVCVKYASSGQSVDLPRAWAAADEVVARNDVGVDIGEVRNAIGSFVAEVMPRYDWTRAVTQSSITTDLEGLGTCNGHPDIILGDGRIFDLKTSARAKDVPSVELGFYALLVESTGREVPAVGYLNYVRLKSPVWYLPEVPVTDELRRWAYENAAAYVRAKKADERLNTKAVEPGNYSMTGGPKFDALCKDCPYNPALGGPCRIVRKEDAA